MTDALLWFLIGWNLVCFGFLGWAWLTKANMDKIFAFVLTVLGTVCVIWLVRNGLIGLLNVCK
jgi:hypothetical protein